MKRLIFFVGIFLMAVNLFAQNIFSVKGNQTYLNGKEFQSIGLRCPNALLSDETVRDLISHLDEYKTYGINTISVYFMGSRYSKINGYNKDATLHPVYSSRMARIIKACDTRGMVVLVGILYWGSGMGSFSNEFYAGWKQDDVNRSMINTIRWLRENQFQNVFVDPDNEGMAENGAKFKMDEMICEGKKVNPGIAIAYNGKGNPPSCADLTIHFGQKLKDKPYIQTEGTPDEYWGEYSKEKGLNVYINVGIYTQSKKVQQLTETKNLLDKGHGYLFSSTWLQNIPPNYAIGGDGSPCSPGMKWWFDFIRENYTGKKN